MQTLVILGLGALTLLAISIERTYRSVPLRELKRRARQGDDMAHALYRAASYGHSLRAVLWFLIGLAAAAFFVVLSRTEQLWVALIGSAALVWIGFIWAPAAKMTVFGRWSAKLLSPFFAWLLYHAHPIIDRIVRFVRRHRPVHFHTGLYEKDDLITMLEMQAGQPDNRISRQELGMAARALSFNDKYVRNFLTPKRMVTMVSVNETVGPVMMDELHKSGHSRFPVYEGRDNIVGTLYLRDLMKSKQTGSAKSIMRPEVSYIHEDETLLSALRAILKTRHHLFIVVNSFEEYVGIISIEDVLEQLIGEPIIDEFDQYEDIRSVAERLAKKEHKEHTQSTTSES